MSNQQIVNHQSKSSTQETECLWKKTTDANKTNYRHTFNKTSCPRNFKRKNTKERCWRASNISLDSVKALCPCPCVPLSSVFDVKINVISLSSSRVFVCLTGLLADDFYLANCLVVFGSNVRCISLPGYYCSFSWSSGLLFFIFLCFILRNRN